MWVTSPKTQAPPIKTITKVQNYMKECISNVEKLFKESLELLKFSKLKEEELKQKMANKDNQIRFWENANEEIESRLNEIKVSFSGDLPRICDKTSVFRNINKNFNVIY